MDPLKFAQNNKHLVLQIMNVIYSIQLTSNFQVSTSFVCFWISWQFLHLIQDCHLGWRGLVIVGLKGAAWQISTCILDLFCSLTQFTTSGQQCFNSSLHQRKESITENLLNSLSGRVVSALHVHVGICLARPFSTAVSSWIVGSTGSQSLWILSAGLICVLGISGYTVCNTKDYCFLW